MWKQIPKFSNYLISSDGDIKRKDNGRMLRGILTETSKVACGTDKDFEAQVDKAYDILWAMFRPADGKGCNWDVEKEEKLHRMLNAIDNELGR